MCFNNTLQQLVDFDKNLQIPGIKSKNAIASIQQLVATFNTNLSDWVQQCTKKAWGLS